MQTPEIDYSDDLTKICIFPNGKLFRLTYDSNIGSLRILCYRHDIFEELQNSFSVDNDSAFFIRQYGYRTAPKLYAINKFGYFGSGLVWEIFDWIKNQYGSLSVIAISKNCLAYINDQLTPLKQFIKANNYQWNISNVADDSGRNNELKRLGEKPLEYRDYQDEAIRQLLISGYGRGLIEIPTAGGKSFILANIYWNLHKTYNRNLKYFILVPNKQLVTQMYKDFISYGIDKHDLTQMTAGNKDYNPNAKIVFANRQYVFKHMNELPKIDVLICDEAHQCLAEQSFELINSIKCPIKLGCSGTLPREKYKRWKILGLFSKVVYEKDIVSLQKQGFISKLKLTLLKIYDKTIDEDKNCLFSLNTIRKYRPDEFGYSDIAFDEATKAETEYFAMHYKELYKPVFEYVKSLNSNTLILFDRIEIGRNLFEYAKELYQDKTVYYIDGTIDINVREDIRNNFEKSDGNLLIAQRAVFSTGINIKRLTNLIFLTGSKSFSQVLQSIGRTLRLHESKTEAHVIDVSWSYKYSTKHLDERLKIYKKFYDKTPDEILTFSI